jgi:hypothetical protein
VQNYKVCSYENEIEWELSLIARYDAVVFNVNSKTTFLIMKPNIYHMILVVIGEQNFMTQKGDIYGSVCGERRPF